VELASALAVINFLSMAASDSHLKSIVKEVESVAGKKGIGKAADPVCNEFSILKDATTPSLFDFKTETQKTLAMPLSQFALFRKYMEEQFNKEDQQLQTWQREEPKLDKDFLNHDFYKNYLAPLFSDFKAWLTELSENNRGFAPFNLSKGSELKSFIIGGEVEEKGALIWKTKVPTYAEFDGCLNVIAKGKTGWAPAKKLLDIFHIATNELLDKCYGLTKKIGVTKK